METNDSILKENQEIQRSILIGLVARANTHGIWLFIATLGCWGVTEPEYSDISIRYAFLYFFVSSTR